MLQSLFVCRRLFTGGTVIPVSLIAVVPTVLEKSVFYGDDDDDDEKCQLNAGIASLRSE